MVERNNQLQGKNSSAAETCSVVLFGVTVSDCIFDHNFNFVGTMIINEPSERVASDVNITCKWWRINEKTQIIRLQKAKNFPVCNWSRWKWFKKKINWFIDVGREVKVVLMRRRVIISQAFSKFMQCHREDEGRIKKMLD